MSTRACLGAAVLGAGACIASGAAWAGGLEEELVAYGGFAVTLSVMTAVALVLLGVWQARRRGRARRGPLAGLIAVLAGLTVVSLLGLLLLHQSAGLPVETSIGSVSWPATLAICLALSIAVAGWFTGSAAGELSPRPAHAPDEQGWVPPPPDPVVAGSLVLVLAVLALLGSAVGSIAGRGMEGDGTGSFTAAEYGAVAMAAAITAYGAGLIVVAGFTRRRPVGRTIAWSAAVVLFIATSAIAARAGTIADADMEGTHRAEQSAVARCGGSAAAAPLEPSLEDIQEMRVQAACETAARERVPWSGRFWLAFGLMLVAAFATGAVTASGSAAPGEASEPLASAVTS